MPRAAKTAKGLTQKQELFALAYLKGATASEAYREVYAPKKLSDKHVANKASALLKRGDIQGRVAELRQQSCNRKNSKIAARFWRHCSAPERRGPGCSRWAR